MQNMTNPTTITCWMKLIKADIQYWKDTLVEEVGHIQSILDGVQSLSEAKVSTSTMPRVIDCLMVQLECGVCKQATVGAK